MLQDNKVTFGCILAQYFRLIQTLWCLDSWLALLMLKKVQRVMDSAILALAGAGVSVATAALRARSQVGKFPPGKQLFCHYCRLSWVD